MIGMQWTFRVDERQVAYLCQTEGLPWLAEVPGGG